LLQTSLVRTSESIVQENNTIDLYEMYFDGSTNTSQFNIEPPSCKTKCVLRDPYNVGQTEETLFKRAVTAISWHPEDPHKVAVAYSCQRFQQTTDRTEGLSYSYIWDIEQPNRPLTSIIPNSSLYSLMYNPRSADQIVGGCYNGQITFFDMRKGKEPVDTSPAEHSHYDPVYDVHWIQSRTGNECCSVSTDGQLLWWDVRRLSAGPTDRMTLTSAQSETFGVSSLEYKTDAGATKYLMGTEQGSILLVDRKAKKDKLSDKSIKQIYGEKGLAHLGPVRSVQRCPTHNMLKYFLTTGDWCARVWNEELRSPILTTPYCTANLTSACWSPTRPGLFYTIKTDGTLDAWDLFFRHNTPAFTTQVSKESLTSIRIQNNGSIVALGDAAGSVTVLELNSALSQPQKNDKARITEIFERETRREKNIEALTRKRESQLENKRKEAAAAAAAAAAANAATTTGAPVSSATLAAVAATSSQAMGLDFAAEEEDDSEMLRSIEEEFFKELNNVSSKRVGGNGAGSSSAESLSTTAAVSPNPAASPVGSPPPGRE